MSFALLWSMFLGAVLLKGVFIVEARFTLLDRPYMVLGDVGAMIVTWLGILIWTRCFGYSLCVYNSFKHEVHTNETLSNQTVLTFLFNWTTSFLLQNDSHRPQDCWYHAHAIVQIITPYKSLASDRTCTDCVETLPFATAAPSTAISIFLVTDSVN
jgi:hypothetical protein